MDVHRLSALSRQILADILSAGSAATAGPVLTPAQEADVLRAVEARLRSLLERHGHESDEVVAARFRAAHPDLYREAGGSAGESGGEGPPRRGPQGPS